jgi:hypothetical protein
MRFFSNKVDHIQRNSGMGGKKLSKEGKDGRRLVKGKTETGENSGAILSASSSSPSSTGTATTQAVTSFVGTSKAGKLVICFLSGKGTL